MTSDSDGEIGLDRIDPEALPDGAVAVIGAAYYLDRVDDRAHPTRTEIRRVVGHNRMDAEQVRYRTDALADSGILKKNMTWSEEKGATVAYYEVPRDDAELEEEARVCWRATDRLAGDVPDQVGISEYVEVVSRMDEMEDRVEDLEAVVGVADDADYQSGAEVLRDDLETLRTELEAVADAQEMISDRVDRLEEGSDGGHSDGGGVEEEEERDGPENIGQVLGMHE